MKKKEFINEEPQQSRRNFLKTTGLGALGLTLGLSLLKSNNVFASNFAFGGITSDDFFASAREVTPNRNDQAAFTDLFNQVSSLVNGNADFEDNVDTIVGLVGRDLPKTDDQLNNLLGTLYLGGISKLRRGLPTKEGIISILSNPRSVSESIDGNFLGSVSRVAEDTVTYDDTFAANLREAIKQLDSFNGVSKTRVRCTLNGEPIACWKLLLIVVVIVVIILV